MGQRFLFPTSIYVDWHRIVFQLFDSHCGIMLPNPCRVLEIQNLLFSTPSSATSSYLVAWRFWNDCLLIFPSARPFMGCIYGNQLAYDIRHHGGSYLPGKVHCRAFWSWIHSTLTVKRIWAAVWCSSQKQKDYYSFGLSKTKFNGLFYSDD